VIAAPKAAKEEHIIEIAGAMGWRLSRKDIEFLDRQFSNMLLPEYLFKYYNYLQLFLMRHDKTIQGL